MMLKEFITSLNIVDYIFIGMVLIYVLFGFSSGLLIQVLGWIEIAVVALTGYLFYKTNSNLLLLPLVVIATAVLFMIIMRVIKSLYFSPYDGEKSSLSYSSRILGGIAGGIKGALIGGFCLVSVYMLSFALFSNSAFTNNFIKHSFFCSFLQKHKLGSDLNIVNILGEHSDIFTTGTGKNISLNKNIMEKLQNNPSFKALLEDKDIINSIKTKDYNKLLFNPKLIKLINDKEFLRQMKSVISEDSNN